MKSRTVNSLLGIWRIMWMETWDQDFIDMEVPAHITFEADGLGGFQFGLVKGQLDCRFHATRVEFSWVGMDECDEATGRGWTERTGEEVQGHLYMPQGEDSAFRAVRAEPVTTASRRLCRR